MYVSLRMIIKRVWNGHERDKANVFFQVLWNTFWAKTVYGSLN